MKKAETKTLHQRAIELYNIRLSDGQISNSETDILKLMQELEVHQIELELQNEELRTAKYILDSKFNNISDKYTSLFDFASSGYIIISAEAQILDLNFRASKMLGNERSKLINTHIFPFISNETKPIFLDFLEKTFKSKVKEKCEVVLIDKNLNHGYVRIEGFLEKDNNCLLNIIDINDYKLIENELKTERSRLSVIIEGTNTGTWEWNIQTGETIFNERWAELIGYSLEEISPTSIETWMKYTHPDDLIVSGELLEKHFKGELNYYSFEARMKHKNGNWIWMLDRGKVHEWDENGKPLLMSGTHQDITYRKKIEEDLEESNEKYRGLSEAAFESIFFSEKGLCIEQNLAGEKTFGYTNEEAFVKYGTEWIVPEDRDMVMKNMLDGYNEPYEATALKKDGSTFPCILQGKMMHYKGRNVRVTSLTDITKQKQAEEKLILQTNLITSLLDSIPDIIFYKDLNGIIIGCNQQFSEIFGKTKNEIIGKNDYEFFEKEITDSFKFNDNLILQKQQTTHNEEWITYTNGTRILVDTLKTPYFGVDGEIIGVLGVSRNITERKKAENELKQLSTRLSLAAKAGEIGVWDYNVINNNLNWDDQMFRLYGVDPKNFTHAYDSWLAGVHSDDKARGDEEIQKAISGEKEFDTEFRVCWPDGSIHNIRANAILVRDETGKAINLIGTNWDITDQKNILEKLKSSEENFRTFFETIDDMIFIANQQGVIFFVNSAVTRKLGYTTDDINGMHVLEVHPADKRNEAEQIFGEMFAGKRDFCPLPLAKKDKTLLPVETRVWFGKWDGKDCIFGISKDITKEQEALQIFNKMFDNNPASMAVSTLPEGVFINVNNALVETTGYSKSEIIGKTSADLKLFIQPEDHSLATTDLEKSGSIGNRELLIRNKSGNILNGLFSGSIIESQGKKMFLTVMTDITKLKQTEEDIRLLASKLSTLISQIPAGIIFETTKRKIQQTNQHFCDIFGIPAPPEALTGADCQEASEMSKLLFIDSENFITRIDQILLKKEVVLNEVLNLVDGRVLQRDYIPIRTKTNELEHLWLYRDITEHNKTEKNLAKQSAMQKILMDISFKYINLPLSEIETSITDSLKALGQFVEADRAYIFEYDWQKYVCINTHEWCEKGIEPQIDFLQNVSLDSLPSWVETHLKGQTMYIPDVMLLPETDGVRLILEPQEIKSMIALPMMNENECIGFIGFDSVKKNYYYSKNEEALLYVFSQMLVNINNRVCLETNLINEKKKAEKADSTKAEFIANMSHEIRTPMNAILGFSESLFHKLESPQHKKMINSVLSSGNLLLSLLNDILDLSKIEAGKIEINNSPFDLKNLLEEIVLLFKDKALQKGLILNVNIAADFPKQIILDENRIKQIIFNLLSNALKFTHQGHINIHATYTNLHNKHGQLHIKISDTGIGIQESQLQNIFEAFNQVSDESKIKYGGAGLGLPITKRLVEKMNGEIFVNSTIGVGSTFKVVFFEVKTSSIQIHRKTNQSDLHDLKFNKASILVVDDIALNIETIEIMLSDNDIDVSSALNGDEAIEKLKNNSYDLILLDLRMPGISGYDLAKIIKNNKKTKHIPVIAYSATLIDSEKDEYSSYFDGFLFKPTKKADLIKQLIKFLKHSIKTPSNLSDNLIINKIIITDPEIQKKLPQIKEILEVKFLPVWENIKDSLVLFNIEAFSIDLKNMAKEYKLKFLADYADSIRENIEILDFDALKMTMKQFPEIIKKISQLIKS